MTKDKPATGIASIVKDAAGKLLRRWSAAWTAIDGTRYVATRNRSGAFAGYRRESPKVRMSKKRRLAIRRAKAALR